MFYCFSWINVNLELCICPVGSIVQNVLDSSPKTKYIVAVDDSNNTLEEITRVDITSIHSRLGTFTVNVLLLFIVELLVITNMIMKIHKRLH